MQGRPEPQSTVTDGQFGVLLQATTLEVEQQFAPALCTFAEAVNAMGRSEVETALNAKEADFILDSANHAFDCILLDIQMPGMDGIEYCRSLRARSPYTILPIIMLTAMSERHYIDRAFSAGATDYLTKPFESVDLMARPRLPNSGQTKLCLEFQKRYRPRSMTWKSRLLQGQKSRFCPQSSDETVRYVFMAA